MMWLSWFLIFIFALAVSSSAADAQAKKLRPLRIALPSHSLSSTPIYVAHRLGIFESLGFEPQILILEPRAALAALLTGDLDFYTAAGTTGRAALRGVPVRVVMVAANRSDLCIVAAKEFTNIEQLRGKTFGGYTAQASANIVMIELLRRKGLKPEDYKILNIGSARSPSLMSGAIPAAVLTSVEAARMGRQGFRVLARASDDIDLTSGGLGTAIASIHNKRDVIRATVQATLEGLRITATQKDRVLPILMKQFALTADEAGWVYDNVTRSWALDGKPTAAANKLDFELTQRDMGLKEPPKMEQIYDFSLLDELAKR